MNVFEVVKKAICRIQPGIDENRITPEALLKEDLEIDSLSKVELALSLEDELDINIQDEKLGDIRTVAQVVSLIESKLKVHNA